MWSLLKKDIGFSIPFTARLDRNFSGAATFHTAGAMVSYLAPPSVVISNQYATETCGGKVKFVGGGVLRRR
jgi:hypothetical protein